MRRWRRTPTTAPGPSGSLSSLAPARRLGVRPVRAGRRGGENDDKEETGRDVDEGEEEGDEVRDHPGDVAAGHGPEERGVEVPVDEAVVRSGVEPEEGKKNGGHGQGAGVDGSLAVDRSVPCR